MTTKTNLQQYYQDTYLRAVREAEKALLLKVKEAVSSMSWGVAELTYDPDAVIATYKGNEYSVEALSIRNGHMVAHLKGFRNRGQKENVPIKDVSFSSLAVLVRNVVAATRFPDNIRRKAETFYGKPVRFAGDTITVKKYLQRLNGVQRDQYIFLLDNGERIALTAADIRRLAVQVLVLPDPKP